MRGSEFIYLQLDFRIRGSNIKDKCKLHTFLELSCLTSLFESLYNKLTSETNIHKNITKYPKFT